MEAATEVLLTDWKGVVEEGVLLNREGVGTEEGCFLGGTLM